jgi:hypothetical protein
LFCGEPPFDRRPKITVPCAGFAPLTVSFPTRQRRLTPGWSGGSAEQLVLQQGRQQDRPRRQHHRVAGAVLRVRRDDVDLERRQVVEVGRAAGLEVRVRWLARPIVARVADARVEDVVADRGGDDACSPSVNSRSKSRIICLLLKGVCCGTAVELRGEAAMAARRLVQRKAL